MSTINVALLGFGTVGKGVYNTIETHQVRLHQIYGKPVKVVAILVKHLNKHVCPSSEILLTDNFSEIEQIDDLHIVVDAIVGTEPAFSYCKRAIEKGCHLVTANKEMFSHFGEELVRLATSKNVSVGFEATVAGGVPVIGVLRQLYQVNKVERIEGILNGTTNYILTKMRKDKISFEEALRLAQEKGYAEADPTNDVEGYDAFYKGKILSQLVFHKNPTTVVRKGISSITSTQIDIATSLNLRFKHVVTLFQENSEVTLLVEPILVSESHPFYATEGVQNIVSIESDVTGKVQFQGPGAGMYPTASAVVEDIANINNGKFQTINTSLIEETNFIEERFSWLVFFNKKPKNVLNFVNYVHPNALLIEGNEDEIKLAFGNQEVVYYKADVKGYDKIKLFSGGTFNSIVG
ncbi:homoserine dehydrogenase [Bacillus sp. FJAT-45066]|uniref:homoserine dehydrogenase n=1 Tax=Bacillus sp. FJAT-45066 TaxID=2011010 RepID=UPI000BB96693|nr:homoserine dehydrogenase [Bacillus sp. FJAT-45066]